ncbi:MAG: class I SAM-dependent methyltransferase [bacterium]|nr:class I SAM-dependent methyltransferase [bacterium]
MDLASQTTPLTPRPVVPPPPARRPVDGEGRGFGAQVARRLLHGLGDPPIALVLPGGLTIQTAPSPPVARLVFHDLAMLLGVVAPDGDLHFGDAYADGRIEVEGDLVALCETVFRVPWDGPGARVAAWWRRLRRRSNSLRGSRRNVHHHYDLGNDFYALWLDREMVYTCAYFPTPDASLEAAQVAKMEHVARKLRLRPGERVIEAGCGWGALALHLARRHGVRVRAFNVSHEQIAWARERAARERLADRVEFVEDDYRNVGGGCDAFVSVGMLEHVGPEHYADLARAIDRTLTPDGRGLLHSIGRNRRAEFSAFIERRIFPGAYAPTLAEMVALLEPIDASVLDVENLRLHYARTLEHWLDRFEAQRDVVARRFDDHFVRTWRLYLASATASFRAGSLQLFQVVFARGRTNAIPWTRADLYPRG